MRNVIPTLIYGLIIVGLLMALIWAKATKGADASCVQTGADPAKLPFALDATKVKGSILSPYVGDFTRWDAPAGKWTRTGTYCDPDGDPVVIEAVSLPAGMSLTQDQTARTWTLSGKLTKGLYYIVLRAVDQPDPNYYVPAERFVTVVVNAKPGKSGAPAFR